MNKNLECDSVRVQFGRNSDIDARMQLVEEISWSYCILIVRS